MSSTINGFTAGYTIAGGVILWSGIKGSSISDTFRSVLKGSTAPQVTEQITGSAAAAQSASIPTTNNGGMQSITGNPTSATESANQATARLMAASYGWSTGQQWTALNNIVMSESGWSNTAQNPGSTAYGIFQFLDTTWATTGYSKSSDPVVQIAAGLAYIKARYGSPVNAWNFHLANGWY
jgi:hypothetical protein